MKGIKKLPLAAAIAVLSASANAELVALDDEVMDGFTGQAGITIETSVKATIDKVTYTDDGNDLSIEGIELSGDGTDDTLTQTVTIDVVENSQLGNALKARAGTGDAIKIGMGDMNADVVVGGIKTTGSTESLGRIEINGLSAEDTTMYVYALEGEKGIGMDSTINQSIKKVTYTDKGYDSTGKVAVNDDNGSIQIHDIKMTEIDMVGTKIQILDRDDGSLPTLNNSGDVVKITQPAIVDGKMTVEAIQIGSTQYTGTDLAGDLGSALTKLDTTPDGSTLSAVEQSAVAAADEVIGGAIIDKLDVNSSGEATYIFTTAGGEGIRISQKMDIGAGEITYVAGLAGTAGAVTFDADGKGDFAARNGDGVGSVSLSEVSFTSDRSTTSIDVTAAKGIAIDGALTGASFSAQDIYLGGSSLGGLSVSGINLTTNTVNIYAH
ncbi:DUF6160 family protein [Parendozoicomonas haliclonae]|uniref:DUF6160 domain-containing protein n=1 Tax=Parendozoicomonas haliclonae TaxID=1960125 RepID=A0A1X7AKP5_9GAMM|nr:DUF6160 family protein [Parendozoicomonas haliclonae]SMA48020.1 hypothetical protein EHSB41UT_02636 [Parendozoicomonas haliclonae]